MYVRNCYPSYYLRGDTTYTNTFTLTRAAEMMSLVMTQYYKLIALPFCKRVEEKGKE